MFNKESKYLFLIVVIFIAACIETDIYLPAFPDMMFFFGISESKIQTLLTWNFFGICLSGPFYGPISDVMGRKKPLMFALGLFLLGSLFTLFAQDFDLMLCGRLLQGLGSGGCFTLGTAVIFDTFQEKKAVLALNKINSICPFIMAGAPIIGGYLNQMYGFRSNFLAIALFVVISFAITLFFFEETLEKQKRVPFEPKKILKNFKKVGSSLPLWQTTLVVSLLFSGYLAFLSGISILFVLEFGIPKASLPYFQASLLGSWLLASLTYGHSIKVLGIPNIKKVGTVLIGISGIGLVGSAWAFPENPYYVTGFMMIYAVGVNWIQGLYFPEGMEIFPDIKGIAASLITSVRLLIAALIVGVTSMLYDGTIYPVAGVVGSIVFVVLAIIIFYEKEKLKLPQKLQDVDFLEHHIGM